MRRLFGKLNNQGSTLLTVIICLALIGILGSMMLSVTLTNLQMKMVERKSKENFYTCEIAMEEIRTGIQELTSGKIKEVYENDILKNFATYLATQGEDERNILIRKKVAVEIIKALGITTGYTDEQLTAGTLIDELNHQLFDGYLSSIPVGTSREVLIGGTTELPISSNGDTVTIKNISVKLTKDTYETTITSDIVITLPTFTFDEGTETIVYRMEQPFKNYTLVADGGIISNHAIVAGASGENIINGSVYAGDAGITVGSQNMSYHSMTINGGTVVSRGDISVWDTGKLTIKGTTQTDPITGLSTVIPPVIWADNLVTNTTGLLSSGETKLDIDGISFIKDDLNLEGYNSKVKLSGAYVGYTGVHTSEGSAIIINGGGSSLDLSMLNSLILSGRAHVSVNDAILNTDANILVGESIAFKSNQRAYLIPGKLIADIKHNPITLEDIGSGSPTIDFGLMEPGDIPYQTYVEPTHPYKIAAKQTLELDSSTILRYYYWDFISGKKADEFLKAYMDKYPAVLDVMDPFSLGEVKLPTASSNIVSVGNRMSYDGLNVTLHKGLSLDTAEPFASYTDSQLYDYISQLDLNHEIYGKAGLTGLKVGKLGELYAGLSYQESDGPVSSKVIAAGVEYIGDNIAKYPYVQYLERNITSYDIDNTKEVVIVKGDAVINLDFTGLLVVDGNVTIADGVTINGMIITVDSDTIDAIDKGNMVVQNKVSVEGRLVAAGNIELGTEDIFTASDVHLVNIFDNYGDLLQNLFRNAEMSINFTIENPADNLVDLSAMISYENWRKR